MQQVPRLKRVDTNSSKKKKLKILLLSDDLLTHSGIATMSKTFVINTVDKYDWVQLACAVTHPHHGKMNDISADVQKVTGVEDASVKLYFNSGYGDKNVLSAIYAREKPDAIMHFTDPRFWVWLYMMEDEVRNEWKIPIMYYAIWDNYPYPLWNKGAYACSDLIMGISKQSHMIHTKVLEYAGVKTFDLDKDKIKGHKAGDVLVRYVPHGIETKNYFPITKSHSYYQEFKEFERGFKRNNNVDFVIYWSNRNIRRKAAPDVIHAFEMFCRKLPPKEAENVSLLMHTDIMDSNGTDLVAVKDVIAPTRKIVFSTNKISEKLMNFNYNLCDITVNIASNEGFGLSSAESLMAGTPVLNNVTGGLQDQCRFEDENGKWFTPSENITSNHTGIYKKHGEWSFPVFPSNISIQGSIPTPYIFDDRASAEDVADQMFEAYKLRGKELRRRGREGHKWVMGNESNMSGIKMAGLIADSIKTCIDNFKGVPRIQVLNTNVYPRKFNMGITPKLRIEKNQRIK